MSIILKLEEMLINPEKATHEGVNALVQEAVQFTNELKIRLASSDESIRDHAKKDALKMQAELKRQIAKLHAAQDKDQSQTTENNLSNLKQLQNGRIGQPKQKKKPKRVKEWLAS